MEFHPYPQLPAVLAQCATHRLSSPSLISENKVSTVRRSAVRHWVCVFLCVSLYGWVSVPGHTYVHAHAWTVLILLCVTGRGACMRAYARVCVCVMCVRACVYKTGECMGTCVSRSYVWVQMQTKWRLGGRETRCEEREVGRGEDKPFNSSSPSLSVH